MQTSESLESLAQRVQQGDAGARIQLRGRLEKQMARIARRALSPKGSATELGEKLQATAQRLGSPGENNPHLLSAVASTVCQIVVNRLWTGSTEARLHTHTA